MQWVSNYQHQNPLEGLLKHRYGAHLPGFWLSRSWWDPENVHFNKFPNATAGPMFWEPLGLYLLIREEWFKTPEWCGENLQLSLKATNLFAHQMDSNPLIEDLLKLSPDIYFPYPSHDHKSFLGPCTHPSGWPVPMNYFFFHACPWVSYPSDLICSQMLKSGSAVMCWSHTLWYLSIKDLRRRTIKMTTDFKN